MFPVKPKIRIGFPIKAQKKCNWNKSWAITLSNLTRTEKNVQYNQYSSYFCVYLYPGVTIEKPMICFGLFVCTRAPVSLSREEPFASTRDARDFPSVQRSIWLLSMTLGQAVTLGSPARSTKVGNMSTFSAWKEVLLPEKIWVHFHDMFDVYLPFIKMTIWIGTYLAWSNLVAQIWWVEPGKPAGTCSSSSMSLCLRVGIHDLLSEPRWCCCQDP